MPWTLYRYILLDLVRHLVLSAVTLVTVMSFAAAIKPLTDGLLGPAALLRFVLLTMPTMLQYILPFAGAYAGVMAFSRLTADNEILACSASGISYRAILMPVIAVGLMLMVGLFFMSNWVVPGFNARAAMTLERDITRLAVRTLKTQHFWKMDDRRMLYADVAGERDLTRAEMLKLDPALPADAQMRWIGLEGVAFSETDEAGRLKIEVAARRAVALIDQYQGQTRLRIKLFEATIYDAFNDQLGSSSEWEMPAQILPAVARDRPRFLSWPRLQVMQQKPEEYDRVKLIKTRLAQAIAREELRKMIADALSGRNTNGILELKNLSQRYILRAPRVEQVGGELLLHAVGDNPVSLDESESGVVKRLMRAQSARLSISNDTTPGADPEPLVQIELFQARVADPRSIETPALHTRLSLPRARWPEDISPSVDLDTLNSLLSRAAFYPQSQAVAEQVRAVNLTIADLFNQIRMLVNKRSAAALDSLLVIVLGALMSIRLRNRMPMAVYFRVFLITAVAVFVSQGGAGNLISQSGSSEAVGLAILWGGSVLVLVLLVANYWIVARN